MNEIPVTYLAIATERRRMFEREVEQDRLAAEALKASRGAPKGRALTVLDLISLFRGETGRLRRAHRIAQREG